MVAIATLGRRGLPAGPVTAPAAGNAVVTSDARGQAAAQPGQGDGINASPVGGRVVVTPASQLGRFARTPAYENGKLIARDRHVLTRRGRTTTSGAYQEPYSGVPNPEADGPPKPAYQMLNRTLSWQIGTDGTRGLDNDAFHAATTAGNRAFPLGNQGSNPWERISGGTPGLYRPYGARGVVEGPAPATYALAGGPYLPGTLVSPGAPGDGPQIVYGGLPHGLHSPTLPATKQTQARYAANVQMKNGRQDRPANSKIAGQSYSQTVVNQDGTGGGRLPRLYPGRQAGVTQRFVARGGTV